MAMWGCGEMEIKVNYMPVIALNLLNSTLNKVDITGLWDTIYNGGKKNQGLNFNNMCKNTLSNYLLLVLLGCKAHQDLFVNTKRKIRRDFLQASPRSERTPFLNRNISSHPGGKGTHSSGRFHGASAVFSGLSTNMYCRLVNWKQQPQKFAKWEA